MKNRTLFCLLLIAVIFILPSQVSAQIIPGYKLRVALFMETPATSPNHVLICRRTEGEKGETLSPGDIETYKKNIRAAFPGGQDREIRFLYSRGLTWVDAVWYNPYLNEYLELFLSAGRVLEISFDGSRENIAGREKKTPGGYWQLNVKEGPGSGGKELLSRRFPVGEQEKIVPLCDPGCNRYFFYLSAWKQALPLSSVSFPRYKFIRTTPPEYPLSARRGGVEGKVKLEAVTDIYGRAVRVRALSGPPLLRRASEEAVKKWVMEPYIISGVPRPERFTVMFHFLLDREPVVVERLEQHAAERERSAPKPWRVRARRSYCRFPRLVKWVPVKFPVSRENKEGRGDANRMTFVVTLARNGSVKTIDCRDGDMGTKEALPAALRAWVFEPLPIMKGGAGCSKLLLDVILME